MCQPGRRDLRASAGPCCIFAFCRPSASACARKQQLKPDSVEGSLGLKSPISPAELKDRTPNNPAAPEDETLQTTKAQHCPSGDELSEASESELDWGAASPRGVAGSDLVALFEECNWVDLDVKQATSSSKGRIAHQVSEVSRVPFQLALAALREEPDRVQRELKEWLGPQYSALKSGKVDFVEVFTGKAPLSRIIDQSRPGTCVRIGAQWGQTSVRHETNHCSFC